MSWPWSPRWVTPHRPTCSCSTRCRRRAAPAPTGKAPDTSSAIVADTYSLSSLTEESHMPDERGRPMGDRARPSPERRGAALTRIRLPLWLPLALVLGVSVLILFLAAGRSKVDLGPSIKGAQDVQVCVLLPDARPTFDV